eukprot:GILJ01007791.1.p1 GENE.GILJ01007791.1~~GILJ01007791.1.p1  ORF type:complete len:868 (+),score=100.81 GILJ01007791.1:188-2791(+)
MSSQPDAFRVHRYFEAKLRKLSDPTTIFAFDEAFQKTTHGLALSADTIPAALRVCQSVFSRMQTGNSTAEDNNGTLYRPSSSSSFDISCVKRETTELFSELTSAVALDHQEPQPSRASRRSKRADVLGRPRSPVSLRPRFSESEKAHQIRSQPLSQGSAPSELRHANGPSPRTTRQSSKTSRKPRKRVQSDTSMDEVTLDAFGHSDGRGRGSPSDSMFGTARSKRNSTTDHDKAVEQFLARFAAVDVTSFDESRIDAEVKHHVELFCHHVACKRALIDYRNASIYNRTRAAQARRKSNDPRIGHFLNEKSTYDGTADLLLQLALRPLKIGPKGLVELPYEQTCFCPEAEIATDGSSCVDRLCTIEAAVLSVAKKFVYFLFNSFSFLLIGEREQFLQSTKSSNLLIKLYLDRHQDTVQQFLQLHIDLHKLLTLFTDSWKRFISKSTRFMPKRAKRRRKDLLMPWLAERDESDYESSQHESNELGHHVDTAVTPASLPSDHVESIQQEPVSNDLDEMSDASDGPPEYRSSFLSVSRSAPHDFFAETFADSFAHGSLFCDEPGLKPISDHEGDDEMDPISNFGDDVSESDSSAGRIDDATSEIEHFLSFQDHSTVELAVETVADPARELAQDASTVLSEERPSTPVHESCLSRRMERLLNDQRFTDLKVVIQGPNTTCQEFQLHKAVMVAAGFSVTDDCMQFCMQPSTFNDVVTYCYQGVLRLNYSLAVALVADRFIPDLIPMAESYLGLHLSVSNCLDLLQLAEKSGSTILMDSLQPFVQSRAESILDSTFLSSLSIGSAKFMFTNGKLDMDEGTLLRRIVDCKRYDLLRFVSVVSIPEDILNAVPPEAKAMLLNLSICKELHKELPRG